MDDQAHAALSASRLPNLHPIAVQSLERTDPELLAVKRQRTLVEYYFTCTPALPLYLLSAYSQVDVLTYLDADLFFYDDPSALFGEMGDGSIAIVPHRFPARLRDRERYGLFNVGWLSFRRDQHALECLQWWRRRCLEWCHDRAEDDRFADQKYLDKWPELFPGVVVIRHKGANVAPWNIESYSIRQRHGRVWIDEAPLLFYHFHGLKVIQGSWYDMGLWQYGVRASAVVRRHIYRPYLKALALHGGAPSVRRVAGFPPPEPLRAQLDWERRGTWLTGKLDLAMGLIRGDYLWYR
jgi:hypothetical protein